MPSLSFSHTPGMPATLHLCIPSWLCLVPSYIGTPMAYFLTSGLVLFKCYFLTEAFSNYLEEIQFYFSSLLFFIPSKHLPPSNKLYKFLIYSTRREPPWGEHIFCFVHSRILSSSNSFRSSKIHILSEQMAFSSVLKYLNNIFTLS